MKKFLRNSAFLLGAVAVIQGCGNSEEAETDADQSQVVTEVESTGEEDNSESEGSDNTDGELAGDVTERELYLIDQHGYVVPRTFQFPQEQEVLKQSLEYMVAGGPITEHLPSGFQAVFPEDTEILGVGLTNDGTAIVDFSPEFSDYPEEQEEAILQATTWTLTQFENVNQVEIQINGHTQENMPQANTPVNETLTRERGINHEGAAPVDITASEAQTLYFISQKDEDVYYVPVTRRSDRTDNKIETVVEELLDGPSLQSNLLTGIRGGLELVEEPQLDDGVLTLDFNESLLTENEGTAVSEEALTMLTLTLTEIEGVDEVAYQVNGSVEINRANGESMSEPVARPEMLNRGEF